jgi:hypothetical protein
MTNRYRALLGVTSSIFTSPAGLPKGGDQRHPAPPSSLRHLVEPRDRTADIALAVRREVDGRLTCRPVFAVLAH